MRALVISSGGSKGAFAGGIAEFLINDYQHCDIFIETSTDSLLIPLLSIEEISRLKTIYTSGCKEDIFSSNPFIIAEMDSEFIMRINHFQHFKNVQKELPR